MCNTRPHALHGCVLVRSSFISLSLLPAPRKDYLFWHGESLQAFCNHS